MSGLGPRTRSSSKTRRHREDADDISSTAQSISQIPAVLLVLGAMCAVEFVIGWGLNDTNYDDDRSGNVGLREAFEKGLQRLTIVCVAALAHKSTAQRQPAYEKLLGRQAWVGFWVYVVGLALTKQPEAVFINKYIGPWVGFEVVPSSFAATLLSLELKAASYLLPVQLLLHYTKRTGSRRLLISPAQVFSRNFWIDLRSAKPPISLDFCKFVLRISPEDPRLQQVHQHAWHDLQSFWRFEIRHAISFFAFDVLIPVLATLALHATIHYGGLLSFANEIDDISTKEEDARAVFRAVFENVAVCALFCFGAMLATELCEYHGSKKTLSMFVYLFLSMHLLVSAADSETLKDFLVRAFFNAMIYICHATLVGSLMRSVTK